MATVSPDSAIRFDERMTWRLRIAVALTMTLGLSALCVAGEWRVTPRVSASETYSDNIALAPAGSEQHDFLTTASPGIAVRGSGGRINLNLAYDMQLTDYARNTAASTRSHRLQAGARADVIDQILSINFASSAGQQNTSNVGVLAQDASTAGGNTTQFFTYSVAPVGRHRLGSYADVVVNTNYSQVFNEGSVGSDSLSNRVTISSGRKFQRLGWSAAYRGNRISNSTGSTSEFRSGNATLSYRINRKWSVNGSTGAEFNDIQTSRSTADSITWAFGGSWTPTSRTSLQANYNHRFFGNAASFNLQHRARRMVFGASFSESATTSSTLQFERVLVPFVDEFGNEIIDPGSGTPILIAIDTPTITDEVIILRRFQGSLAWRGQRSTASMQVSNQLRNFEVSGDEESVFSVSARLSRTLSRGTSASLGANWQTSEFPGARSNSRWSVDVGLTHRLARTISGGLSLRHLRNTSDTGRDVAESRAVASLNVGF